MIFFIKARPIASESGCSKYCYIVYCKQIIFLQTVISMNRDKKTIKL